MKETKSTPAADIRELVTAVKAQMSGLGYSQYTIDRMDAVWKNLASYCEEHNDGLLTAESARCFVWDLYGAVLGEKDTSQNVNRAVHILLDFQQFGIRWMDSARRSRRLWAAHPPAQADTRRSWGMPWQRRSR